MSLTDEQLAALGLAPPPPPPPAPASTSALPPILPPSGPLPQSSLGAKIMPGASIPHELMHAAGKAAYQQEMPQVSATPGSLPYYQQKIAQMDFQHDHPAGSPISEHPGILGKIEHGFATAGNIAGDILAPGPLSLIHGTDLNNRAQYDQAEKGLTSASENDEREAQAGHTTAETGEIPDQEKNLEATTAHTTAETNALTNPEPKTSFEKTSDGSIVQMTTEPHTGNSTAKLVYRGDPKVETQIATLQVGGKPHSVLVNKTSGATIKDLGETKEPAAPGGAASLIVTPEGQVEQVKPGMTLAPGTQNLSGFASMNRPTTTERNVGAQAKLAASQIPDVIAEVTSMKDSLGPISGRWNEFMQGKVGLDDPKFAGLRADLMMLSSAVALAHARGRLPENLRQEFDHMINTPQQDPRNIISTLQHIQPWLKKAGEMGDMPGKQADSQPQGGPTVGAVENGYRFKGGDAGKQENWEKTQ